MKGRVTNLFERHSKYPQVETLARDGKQQKTKVTHDDVTLKDRKQVSPDNSLLHSSVVDCGYLEKRTHDANESFEGVHGHDDPLPDEDTRVDAEPNQEDEAVQKTEPAPLKLLKPQVDRPSSPHFSPSFSPFLPSVFYSHTVLLKPIQQKNVSIFF